MFTIKIADLLVEIDNRYDEIEKQCKGYIVEPDREPDIRVSSTNEILEEKCLLWGVEKQEDGSAPWGRIEYTYLHESIYPHLPEFNAAWMHACVVDVDGEGYAFTAPSGYGKTTQALLWLDYFGSRARIINGDNPIIRFVDGGCYVYGTPFGGSEGYQCNTRVPLKGICFLNRSDETFITRMDTSMAFAQMMWQNQKHDMLNSDNVELMMKVWERITEYMSFYHLHCNQSYKAVEIAYHGMSTQLVYIDTAK